MPASNINRCMFSGNLTRDPELKDLGSTKVCNMRMAVNSRVKRNGEWVDKPNYINVAVFGRQGENCAQYLSRGSGLMVDARMDWREWDKDGERREAVQFIADNVQFLTSPGERTPSQVASTDVPASSDDFTPAGDFAPPPADDDIPF